MVPKPLKKNLTTLSILTAWYSRIIQIRETSFTSRITLLVIYSSTLKRAIFEILKTAGEP
jgi:hypothetical protein